MRRCASLFSQPQINYYASSHDKWTLTSKYPFVDLAKRANVGYLIMQRKLNYVARFVSMCTFSRDDLLLKSIWGLPAPDRPMLIDKICVG